MTSEKKKWYWEGEEEWKEEETSFETDKRFFEAAMRCVKDPEQEKVLRLLWKHCSLQNNHYYVERSGDVSYLLVHEAHPTILKDLRAFKGLKKLEMRSCGFTRFEGFEVFSMLEDLVLRWNNIRVLECKTSLPSLRRLNLKTNQIEVIGDLRGLDHLRMLDLSDNNIEKIQNLEPLGALEELYIAHNRIKRIEGLEGLKNLKILNLLNNKIERIQGLKGLERLETLTLSLNNIKKIEGLDSLKNLRNLILERNSISKIEGVDALPSLFYLDVSENKITQVEVENLGTIKSLNLYDNPIRDRGELEGIKNVGFYFD